MVYKEIRFNWRQVGDINDGLGEDYDFYEVGKKGVVRISNMTPTDYTGPEFYDVDFRDGRTVTIYNVNQAFQVPGDHK